MINYWVISPNVRNDGNVESWKKAIRLTRSAFMGWDTTNYYGNLFFSDVKIGDVVLVAARANRNKELVGAGIVAGRPRLFADEMPENMPGDLDCYSWIKLDPFIPLKDDPKTYGLDFTKGAYGNANQIPAIYQLKPAYSAADRAITEWCIKRLNVEREMQNEKAVLDLCDSFCQIILHGPPGTSKTYLAKKLAERILGITDNKVFEEKRGTRWNIVQFHPAYNYEDFVRGVRVETDKDGKAIYSVKNGIFAKMADQAACSKGEKYVLIIDEINRANLAGVLGELIYALEYRDSDGHPSSITTPYELPEKGHDIKVPENFVIIGTMNTADRSIGHIDYAIRRRFAFVAMPPKREVVEMANADVIREKALEYFDKVTALFLEGTLSKDFYADDVQIGHTYFLAKDIDELKRKLRYQVVPILREYLRDGVLTQKAKEVIDELEKANG